MSRTVARVVAAVLTLSLIAAACSDSKKSTTGGTASSAAPEVIDYKALGLWDDGPCDVAKPKLVIGLITVFESALLSLKDQATALEVSAKAFNARGGANGSCIEVHTCDDKSDQNQALACVRELDQSKVVATVNDQGTAAQADVASALRTAKISRVASNVTQNDWDDANAYPLDASGTGVTFLMPKTLTDQGVTNIAMIRVDLAAASALVGLLGQVYKDATFSADIPVPATDNYDQFVIAAQSAGAKGMVLALGENEAVQVVRAAKGLNTELKVGASLGTFSHKSTTDLGAFADQMSFIWSFPPATTDIPAYTALRADLAASGEDALQPQNLKASPMRSWIGLYALLKILRDAKVTDFTRDNVATAVKAAKDVPMLGIFGGENWTPNTDHSGLYKRAGTNHWAIYKWDANATAPGGLKGNFVETSVISFDKVLCGSIFGDADGPC